ncbi:hypothetical protein BU14_0608s0014 [Porphyra umbilicalis]|uniref:Checkpoint protein n=1 Tax=Porphyra umbilicalis TaxID=2786 RepID=A0A1X6NR26_PORUM|nr:hypothetical protein BU14_0608s0014 [Porphyra umbilicalis]|eukprot:OSX71069.1 hypothetical protein BU14_0608s0014 [Porphyra umbilicalis]
MDATLTDGMAIRTLARVLTAAAKIGDNICVEPQARSLALRALSSQKSAAVEFVLDGTFFDTYLLLPSPLTQAPGGADGSLPSTPITPVTPRTPSPPPAVVVAAKLLLPIFRSPAGIERLTLALPAGSPRLSIHIAGVAGVTKTFSLPALVGTLLQPVAPRANKACRFECRPGLLTSVLSNFHARLEEVTLAASGEGLRLSSYVSEGGSSVGSPVPPDAAAAAGGAGGGAPPPPRAAAARGRPAAAAAAAAAV